MPLAGGELARAGLCIGFESVLRIGDGDGRCRIGEIFLFPKSLSAARAVLFLRCSLSGEGIK